MRHVHLTAVLTTSLVLAHCSVRQVAVQQMGEMIASGIPAFEKDGDLELVKDALPANIKLLEVMLESDPGNGQLLALLAQMYASYTFAFVEADLDTPRLGDKAYLKDRLNRLYQKGMDYGARALVQADARCERGLQVAVDLDACLSGLGKSEVSALYWYGFNLAAYLNRNLNSLPALAQGPKMAKVMERVIAVDEPYNFGTAHLFLMLYHGARTPMMGGSATTAEGHYQALKRLAGPDFLLGDVYRARYVLVQQEDRPGFEKTMKAVLATKPDDDKIATMRLYNSLARARAKLYLNSIEDFF